MTSRRDNKRMRSTQRLVMALVVVACVIPAPPAQQPGGAPVAQSVVIPAPGVDSVLDARVKGVASHLRCPVCQGESIQDSPAELAAQMKTLVREQLVAGRSEQQVLDYFVEKYGQWILLAPKAEGFNLLVYWLPVVFLCLGAGIIWIAVKRWTRPASEIPAMAVDAVGPKPPANTPLNDAGAV